MGVGAATSLYGSGQGLRSGRDSKKRLAYSTVSQVSYITLGVACLAHRPLWVRWLIWCTRG